MKKVVFVLVGAFALASSAALAKDIKAKTTPVEMSDADMDKVTGGGIPLGLAILLPPQGYSHLPPVVSWAVGHAPFPITFSSKPF